MRMCIALVLLTIATPVFAQTSGSSSGASSMVDINSPSSSTTRLITTPTIAAPGLAAAGVETCLGSSAGGLSLMGGGFTFGSTKVDDGCTIRLLSRQLYAFGFQKAALALMCEDDHVAIAMAEVGSPCPARAVEVSNAPARPARTYFDQATTGSLRQSDSEPVPQSDQGSGDLAFAPVSPYSDEERTWFDRASNMK
jgi:hypothetical protein